MKKQKISDKLKNIKKSSINSDYVESYKKIILRNEKLVQRGLSKHRGYTLATITDEPILYKRININSSH